MVRIIWITGGLIFLTFLMFSIFTPTGDVNDYDSFIFEMPG